jgi:phosphoribosylanthranilate isomerase
VRNVAEAELALAHGAAAIGLVSRMPSDPGVVGEAAVAEVARAMAGRIETFLLTAERIADQVKRLQPSVVQLVDALPPDEIARLRAVAPGVSIVSVVHVLGPEAVEAGAELGRVSDALLRDSGNPGLAVKELGGTGRTHNWATSTEIVEAADVPVWLAGGARPRERRRRYRAGAPPRGGHLQRALPRPGNAGARPTSTAALRSGRSRLSLAGGHGLTSRRCSRTRAPQDPRA